MEGQAFPLMDSTEGPGPARQSRTGVVTARLSPLSHSGSKFPGGSVCHCREDRRTSRPPLDILGGSGAEGGGSHGVTVQVLTRRGARVVRVVLRWISSGWGARRLLAGSHDVLAGLIVYRGISRGSYD